MRGDGEVTWGERGEHVQTERQALGRGVMWGGMGEGSAADIGRLAPVIRSKAAP